MTDNVLAGGSVVDPEAKPKRYTELMKTFNKTVANHPIGIASYSDRGWANDFTSEEIKEELSDIYGFSIGGQNHNRAT